MAEADRIDRRLNLIISIEDNEDPKKAPIAWAHHSGISQDVFRQYWKIIGQTMQALAVGGVALYAPRYACYQLIDLAKAQGIWEDKRVREETITGIKTGLYNELVRRTNIALPKASGWEQVPFDDVKRQGLLTDDQIDEVEGAIVFFTVGSRSQLQSQREDVLGGLLLWNAQSTSSSFSEFMSSLRTSKKSETTGETQTASSPTS